MRRVVVADDLSETEIRPPEQVERYYALSETESAEFFEPDHLVHVPCPFCRAEDSADAFRRWTFLYRECRVCRSLFVSPRPSADELERFRATSRASALWREVLRETGPQRDERVLFPRLSWVANLVAEQFREPVPYADWGPTSLAYLQQVARIPPFSSVRVLEPEPTIADACKEAGWCAGRDDGFGAMVSFDVVNGTFSPETVVETASRGLVQGGLLFLTGRAAGFELQILWESAPHLHPLDHLNLPTIEGIERLLGRFRFELLELSTPGQLDLNMVIGAVERHASLPVPRWLRYFIDFRDESEHRAFQEFLQRARLSSHFRVASRKQNS